MPNIKFKNFRTANEANVHELFETVIITICVVISGCEYWEEIVNFCRVKENWFREKLDLELKTG